MAFMCCLEIAVQHSFIFLIAWIHQDDWGQKFSPRPLDVMGMRKTEHCVSVYVSELHSSAALNKQQRIILMIVMLTTAALKQ